MSYFPDQTVSTCNKSRHLRERGKEAVRCCLLASQQATEVIPARQPFYTLLGAKLSLCETFSWGAVMDDCTGTMEQVCGSSPLEASSKGEEPHGAQSWMTAQGQWGAVMDDCTGTKEHGTIRSHWQISATVVGINSLTDGIISVALWLSWKQHLNFFSIPTESNLVSKKNIPLFPLCLSTFKCLSSEAHPGSALLSTSTQKK